MRELVRPLPASVYRRRRMWALGSGTLVLLVLVWAVLVLGGGGAPKPAAVQLPRSVGPMPVAVAPPAMTPPGAVPPGAPPSGLAGGLNPFFPDLTTTAAPDPAPTPTTSAAPPPSTESAAAAPPCADGVVAVLAQTERPSYRVGEKPVFRLVVTNTGTGPCTRDFDSARQEVIVNRADGHRVWSSNDCYPGGSRDLRTLQPGQQAVFGVRWSGRGSRPGCAGARSPAPPGDYQLVTRQGEVLSKPVSFTLTR